MDSVAAIGERTALGTRAGHSARLRLTIHIASPRVYRLSRRFWTHPRLRVLFPEYLMTLYASMRATVPLLELAAERAASLAVDDPVADALVPYFRQHAREELHHDEWLLEDMAALGMDASLARRRHAPPDVAAMIGAQYYWLQYSHPVCLLGCFAVLEGSPPETEALDQVVARTGVPPAALRTLYKHAQLDPHHRDDLDAVLDGLPLTPEQAGMVGISALTTVDQLGGILQRLVRTAGLSEA